jgi:hypothetical protein
LSSQPSAKMIEIKEKLTTTQIEDIFQSMSAAELWALHRDAKPIDLLRPTAEEMAVSERIWAIMDATGLEYNSVEKILFSPQQAMLGEIEVYCRELNINVLEFIEKALA